MHRFKNKNKNRNKNKNIINNNIEKNISIVENKEKKSSELIDRMNNEKINNEKKKNDYVNIKNIMTENIKINNENIGDINDILKKKIISNDNICNIDIDIGEIIENGNMKGIVKNNNTNELNIVHDNTENKNNIGNKSVNITENNIISHNDDKKWCSIIPIKKETNTNEQKNIHNLEFRLYDNENVPRYKKKIMSETYEQYILKLNLLDKQKSKWIYNIIDGKSEQDKIIFMDDKFILMPTYFWNEEDLCKMHLLAIVKNVKLKSLRDLRFNDVPLLEHILLISKNIIKNKYNIEQNLLKIYVHYPPSAWLFHIHFEMMSNIETTSSVEYSHEISQIIFNLKLCSEYYKLFDVNTLNNND